MKMSFYDIFMCPIEFLWLKKRRKALMKHAFGNLLEIGFGTGANYQFYDFNKVKSLTATDVFIPNIKKPDIKYIKASACCLPFEDNSFDTVVSGLVMCSVDDVELALNEIRRVLKSGGRFIFMEHIRPNNRYGEAFDKVNEVWKKNSFGCQINKNTLDLILKQSFKVNYKIYADVLCYGVAINIK